MPAKKKILPETPIPYPFRSSVHASDEERCLLFTEFLRRFELRHGLSRSDAVAAMAIRLSRTTAMIYHWLSKAKRNRAIPWGMLDVLIYEELMVDRKTNFGHDVMSMYQISENRISSSAAAGTPD